MDNKNSDLIKRVVVFKKREKSDEDIFAEKPLGGDEVLFDKKPLTFTDNEEDYLEWLKKIKSGRISK